MNEWRITQFPNGKIILCAHTIDNIDIVVFMEFPKSLVCAKNKSKDKEIIKTVSECACVDYSGSWSGPARWSLVCSNLLESDPCLSGSVLCVAWAGVSSGVDGYLGGDEAGVLKMVVVVIFSRKPSSCFSDRALCSVSSGRIGGTPNPSSTKIEARVAKLLKLIYAIAGSAEMRESCTRQG